MQRRGHGRASLSIRRFPELPFRPRGPSPCASSPPPPDELGWPELKQPVTQDMNMGTVVAKALSWAAGSRRTHGQPAPDSPCEEGAPLLTQGPAFLRLWAPPPPLLLSSGAEPRAPSGLLLALFPAGPREGQRQRTGGMYHGPPSPSVGEGPSPRRGRAAPPGSEPWRGSAPGPCADGRVHAAAPRPLCNPAPQYRPTGPS